MYYLNLSYQVSFLITLCFSFLIFVFTVCLNKENSLIKLMGTAFFTPFFLSAFAFLFMGFDSYLMIAFSESLLLIFLFLLLYLKLKPKIYNIVQSFLLVVPALVFLLAFNVASISNYLDIPYVNIPLFIIPALLILFILRKEKGSKNIFFWAVLCILSEFLLIQIDKPRSILVYLSISLKLSAYICFFIYFFKSTMGKIMATVVEAEEKLSAVDRSLNFEIKKRTIEIERSNEKLLTISKTDSLTKAFNKSAILSIIESLTSAKSNAGFSVIMFDIDNFKIVNDTLGHIEGDKCIRKVSAIAKASIREIDSLGRYGGDEFIMVLPSTNVSQAKLTAERFRKKVDETESPHFTVSIGVASYPYDGTTAKELVAAADQGLYLSKEKGKNAVSHKDLF